MVNFHTHWFVLGETECLSCQHIQWHWFFIIKLFTNNLAPVPCWYQAVVARTSHTHQSWIRSVIWSQLYCPATPLRFIFVLPWLIFHQICLLSFFFISKEFQRSTFNFSNKFYRFYLQLEISFIFLSIHDGINIFLRIHISAAIRCFFLFAYLLSFA